MTYGINLRVPQTDAVPGPVVPVDLHSNGVPGASHRYVTYSQTGAAGSAINVIPDTVDGYYLRPVGTNGAPVIGTAGAFKTAQFPGNSDYLLRSLQPFAGEFTVAVVCRIPSAASYAFRADGYLMGRGNDGVFRAYGANDTAAAGAFGPGLSDFAVLFFQRSTTDVKMGFIKSDGTTQFASTSGVAPNLTYDDILAIGGPSATVRDILEVNVWNSVLDRTKCAAHDSAMRAKYGNLIATY